MRKKILFLFAILALASIWIRSSALAAGPMPVQQVQQIQARPASTSTPTTTASQTEDWKGTPDSSELDVSALTGIGIIDTSVGFTIMGAISKKIVHHGFIPDINNSVSIELEAGPLFIQSSTAVLYNAHLRWDFVKDPEWTFYSFAGLGGNIRGQSLGNHFVIHPSFGAGAIWNFYADFGIRGELAAEQILAGAVFAF